MCSDFTQETCNFAHLSVFLIPLRLHFPKPFFNKDVGRPILQLLRSMESLVFKGIYNNVYFNLQISRENISIRVHIKFMLCSHTFGAFVGKNVNRFIP